MAHIFVSYSRADVGFIEEFVQILEKAFPQHDIWYDDHITGGDDWWNRILTEIRQGDLFIYLLSNDSIASEYCWAEFREALRLRKRCLPVLVRPKTRIDKFPADLQPIINQLQWIDLSQGFKDYKANAELYAAISAALASQTPAYVPPVVQPATTPQPPVEPPVTAPLPPRPTAPRKLNGQRSRLVGMSAVVTLAVIGIIAGGLLMTSQLPGLQPPPEPTATATVTTAPTLTSSPTELPTLPPTETLVPMLFGPVEFVGAYYALLNNEGHPTAWSWLSKLYQEERTPRGYEVDYLQFYARASLASVRDVVLVTETDTEARVHAQLRLEYKPVDGTIPAPSDLPICYDLVRQPPYWLINYTCGSVPLSQCQDTRSRPVNTPCT
jgi:TIR domain